MSLRTAQMSRSLRVAMWAWALLLGGSAAADSQVQTVDLYRAMTKPKDGKER